MTDGPLVVSTFSFSPASQAILSKAVNREVLCVTRTEEPLPPDSPLFSMPNVILTPHISGVSDNYDQRLTALFAENLRRYRAGEPLLNRYDPTRGY